MSERPFKDHFENVDFDKRIILVTGHRRESFGGPLIEICEALKDIASAFNDVEIIYPVHKNPNVQEIVTNTLKGESRIHLMDPLDYTHQLWLMSRCHFIVTDSGGIQEEAPTLGKPVLVTRKVTERQEVIDSGSAKLVGTHRNKILEESSVLLTREDEYTAMSTPQNPFGDGTSSKQIVEILHTISYS